MKRKILSAFLAVALLLSMVAGLTPVTAKADSGVPSVALYVNGTWVAAQNLEAGSGEIWLSFPISGEYLVNNADNYLRLTSNVANGDAADSQVKLYFTNSTWSNSFLSAHIWVDDNWSGYSNQQANFYIEGWDGSQWRRIHDDVDAFYADDSKILGKNSNGSYTNYARNIWVGDSVVEQFRNFRVKCHLYVGNNLTVNEENAPLFPANNYHNCIFCEYCGNCKSDSCSLSHAVCGCKNDVPSLAFYMNGTWFAAQSLVGESGNVFVTVPIVKSLLADENTNYLRITSNVANGNSEDTQLKLYFTDSTWTNTYMSPNWWVDDSWSECTNKQANVWIEGWDGSQWRRIHDDVDAFEADSATVLGKTENGSYLNYARNIWVGVGALAQYSDFRIKCQLYVGSNLQIQRENVALFANENYTVCDLCNDCGGCKAENCTMGHRYCAGHEAVRVRVNGQWYGLYLSDLLNTDGQWINIPINMEGMVGGTTYPVSISSSIRSTENYGAGSIDLYATAEDTAFESYLTNNPYCDDGWMQYGDRNINVKLEGWNGHQWIDLSATASAYDTTGGTTVLGLFAPDGNYYNAARNITLINDLSGISAMRVSAQVHIGENVQANAGFVEGNFATFLGEQTVDTHKLCNEHSGCCTDANCQYSCAKLHTAQPVIGWSLSLGDSIGANFYAQLTAEEANAAVMYITVDGATVNVSPVATETEGVYRFSANVAAAQMTQNIIVELAVGGETLQIGRYKVTDYAKYILSAENGYDEATKNLVKAMLGYGAAAQTYFNYATEELADAGYEIAFAQVPNTKYNVTIDQSVSGIKFHGATVVFESKTAVRLYFAAESMENYTFKAGQTSYEAKQKDGLYYVEIDGIAPQQMAQEITLSISDGANTMTVTYSPMHYITRMYNGAASENLKALLAAMYNYHLAAVNYENGVVANAA